MPDTHGQCRSDFRGVLPEDSFPQLPTLMSDLSCLHAEVALLHFRLQLRVGSMPAASFVLSVSYWHCVAQSGLIKAQVEATSKYIAASEVRARDLVLGGAMFSGPAKAMANGASTNPTLKLPHTDHATQKELLQTYRQNAYMKYLLLLELSALATTTAKRFTMLSKAAALLHEVRGRTFYAERLSHCGYRPTLPRRRYWPISSCHCYGTWKCATTKPPSYPSVPLILAALIGHT